MCAVFPALTLALHVSVCPYGYRLCNEKRDHGKGKEVLRRGGRAIKQMCCETGKEAAEGDGM